jgi:hypothetical protein
MTHGNCRRLKKIQEIWGDEADATGTKSGT